MVALFGITAYSLTIVTAMVQSWPHYELLGLLLRYALLLPAIIYGLRSLAAAIPGTIPARRTAPVIVGFFMVAALVGWHVNPGLMVSDEASYRFEANILATGKHSAAPPRGATDRPRSAPMPIRFDHITVWKKGWFSKYPIGWPAVLALPERLHLGWLVNPVLGAALLTIIGAIAQDIFGPARVLPAVGIAAFSPYFLANSVGRLSHTLCAVLVALACLLCIKGLKKAALSPFLWMFFVLVPTFHVRPYTAFLVSVVLGLAALIGTRTDRSLCIRVGVMGMIAAVCAGFSVVLYNHVFTGSALLSPYALHNGVAIPDEVHASAAQMIQGIGSMWRFALEQTMFYIFPFVIPLALYAIWVRKPKSATHWVLLAIPCALVLGYLVQVDSSASSFGERYWFEGCFGLVVLAADGLILLLSCWRTDALSAATILAGVSAAQLIITAGTIVKIEGKMLPSRQMYRLAEKYSNCNCVVYIEDTPPVFFGKQLNLNGPEWPSAPVFYAVDPGPEERRNWTTRFGKAAWVVLKYDSKHRIALEEGSGS